MINRKLFYDAIRSSKGLPKLKTLSASQVQGMEAILNMWQIKGYTDIRWLAYMLATIYHECDGKMMPIEEYGKGKTRPYGRKLKHSGVAYSKPDQIYYGRGFVQLTWYENYELMGRLLGADLLSRPELALDLTIATQVLFEGMTKGSSSIGDFTGKCLEMYFNATTDKPDGARAIINGSDKAALITTYHKAFLLALKAK